MIFNLSKLSENVKEITQLFLNNHGYKCDNTGIALEYIKTENKKIKVEYTGAEIIIYAPEDVQFYRAIHLFLQQIKFVDDKPFVKEELCYFSQVGIMLDCSRNGTISIDMLKKFIRLCAACGINQLYLYMEDVYEIKQDPYFGAYRSKYTQNELKEIDKYGLKYGVEIIPTIQTLAHLHTYLRWPKTKILQDTEDILLVESKETEEFVRLMIENVSKPFSTKKIHVGMDEADLLGLGKYLKIHGYKERYQIMTSHLDMVNKICNENGLEMMIWSDMFFRLKSPTGDYYDLDENTEFDLSKPIDENITLVYWDYYHHNKEIYDKNIALHKKLSDNLCFAGGGWTWNGISPNYQKASATLKQGLKSCKENDIDRAFCTFWFDNGTETPVQTSIYSMIYFAQLCYNDDFDEKSFDKWLKLLTGYSNDEFKLLDAFDSTNGTLPDNQNADNPSKYLLYQDTLAGIFDGQIYGLELDKYYNDLYDKIKKIKPKDTDMDIIFSYYIVLAQVLKDKSMLGIELRTAYHNDDKEQLDTLKYRALECAKQVYALKELRKKIWFNECRPFGFEVLDIRLGGVYTRLNSAVDRIKDYLDGNISKIEELEEPLIIYNEDTQDKNHKLCMGGFWQNIVSAGNIAGI